MNARQMGRKGGHNRSAAKQAAARRNGKLGGRPMKTGSLGNSAESEVFAQRVLAEQARLAPLLSNIDPHDLNLILGCMMTPLDQRLLFLLPLGNGHAF